VPTAAAGLPARLTATASARDQRGKDVTKANGCEATRQAGRTRGRAETHTPANGVTENVTVLEKKPRESTTAIRSLHVASLRNYL